jgi:hypothetical protein
MLCINSFHLDKVNQYCTGLKCVIYSITQVKTQLHEKIHFTFFQKSLIIVVPKQLSGITLKTKSYDQGFKSVPEERKT